MGSDQFCGDLYPIEFTDLSQYKPRSIDDFLENYEHILMEKLENKINDVYVLALVKEEERYVFLFDDKKQSRHIKSFRKIRFKSRIKFYLV